MQEKNVEKEFLPLVSKPGWIITWLSRIFLLPILLIALITFSIFPLLICEDVKVLVVVAILYYPVWAVAMYRFFRFMKKSVGKSIIEIKIDDEGVHYYRKNGSKDDVLYGQLESSYLSENYDVHLERFYKTWVLAVRVKGEQIKILFDTDAGVSYYTRNGRALRARFIEGIVRFRPDLKIDPFVFEEFSIHPENFTFDGKRYLKHVGEAAMIGGIILLLSLVLLLIVAKV